MDYLQKKSIRSVAAAITGFLRHSVRKIGITREKLPSCIALAVCPLVTFYLFEMYTHNPFTTMHFKTQLLNMAFYVLTALLLFGIVKYVRAALMLQTAFFMVVGLANYYVLNFRSAPIMPWDIYSISTAASVAGNFNYELSTSTILVIVGFLILLLIESRFHMKAPGRVAKRAALILLSIVMIYGYTGMIQSESFVQSFGLYDKLFTPTVMNKRDGNIVAFLMEMEYLDVEKPADYSADGTGSNYEQAGKDSAGLAAAVEDPESVKRPNIIVIMDEAFSDLKVLGPLETNEDYMPFMHRMQQGEKNTVTGYVQTSVCGGNTADSEFEFLTGNTMAFLPNGSIPYQQYIKSRTPSLAGYLKSLGYATYAQHPYQASGWNRDKVYPLLGFDNLDFMEDYRDVSYVRNYISDASDMEHIIETYEKNKASGKPTFIFNVTMQNHGGYTDTYMNLTNDIQSQYASEPLNQYLTLIHKTDQALENLIDYFSKVDDRTIIVFFGDHQPNDTVASVVENGAQAETQKRYLVPYLVWSNYGIEGAKDKNTSLNYLAAQVLTAAGVPTNAYQNYLLSLSKTYPVISAAGQTKGIGADEKQLQTYKKLQYYQLFEKNKEKDE